eukprot:Opistho-2@68754
MGDKPPLQRGNSRKESSAANPGEGKPALSRGNSRKEKGLSIGADSPGLSRKGSKEDRSDEKRPIFTDEQRAVFRKMTVDDIEREMHNKTEAIENLSAQISDIYDPPAELQEKMETLDKERSFLRIMRDEKKKAAVLEPLRYAPLLQTYLFNAPDSINNIVMEDDDGSGTPRVKGATLFKLIERLTYDEYADHNFQRQFLLTFRTFVEPLQLLELLIARYDIGTPRQASLVDDFARKIALPVRLRVCNVLKRWVEHHYDDFEKDPELFKMMKEFISGRPAEDAVRNIFEKLGELMLKRADDAAERRRVDNLRRVEIEKEKERRQKQALESTGTPARPSADSQKVTAPSSSSTGDVDASQLQSDGGTVRSNIRVFDSGPPPPILPMLDDKGMVAGLRKTLDDLDILNFDPMEIARQMTLIEFGLYEAISPHDLSELACNSSADNSSAIVRFIDRFNKTSMWATTQIVSRPSLQSRKDALAKFIDIAECCLQLNNFNGLLELMSSLQSAPVHRLKHTWTILPSPHKQRFEELAALTSNTNNYRDYRKLISSINPPCIPYIGIYMTDLTFIRDGNPNLLPNTELINFTKRRMISAVLIEMLQYQQTPYHLADVPVLRTKLDKITHFDEQACYKQSLKIEPRNADAAVEKKKRVAFLIDTAVRGGKAKRVWAKKLCPRAIELFGDEGWAALMIEEESFDEGGPAKGKVNPIALRSAAAQQAAKAVNNNFDAVVVVGDGKTVNLCIEGYIAAGGGSKQVPFGIIAISESDDFIKTADIPADPLDALACIFDGFTVMSDVGVVQASERGGLPSRDQFFLNVCSVGTESTRVSDLANKAFVGRASLLLQSVTHGSKASNRATRMKIDDSDWMNCNMFELLVCNGKFYGSGFEIAPEACMTDGQFDIVLLEDVSMLEASRVSHLIRRGDHINNKNIHLVRGSRVVVEDIGKDGAKLDIEADEQNLGSLPATIVVLREAVALIVPRTQNNGRADSVVTRRASLRNLGALSIRRSSSLTGLNLQANLAKRNSVSSDQDYSQAGDVPARKMSNQLMRSASDTVVGQSGSRQRSKTDPEEPGGSLSRNSGIGLGALGKSTSSVRKKRIVPFGVDLEETLLREKSEIPRAFESVERYVQERVKGYPTCIVDGLMKLGSNPASHTSVSAEVDHLKYNFERRKEEAFELSQEHSPDVALCFLRAYLTCLPVPLAVGVYGELLEAGQVTDVFAEGSRDGWLESHTRETYIEVIRRMGVRNRSVLAYVVGFLRQHLYERSPKQETLRVLGQIFAPAVLGTLAETNVYQDDPLMFENDADEGQAHVLQTLVVFWDELLLPFLSKRTAS